MQNKIPKIVVCGNYGARNFGDEGVLDGILFDLKKNLPHFDVTVLSVDPNQTSNEHSVIALPLIPTGIRSFIKGIFKRTIFKTLHAIKKADMFILGGGTLFTDEKRFSFFLWGIHAFYALMWKVPVYIYAQGIGPLKSRVGRFIVRLILSHAQIITFRDRNSQIQAKSLSIRKRSTVTADPAFILDEITNERTNKPLLHIKGNYIVFNYRAWNRKLSTSKIANEIAGFIDYVNEKYQFDFILLPFQEYREKDSDFMNKIFEQVKNKKNVHIFKFCKNYKQALDIIKNAHLLIGTRLHSLIFAVITGTPFFAINYSQKVENFTNDLDLSHLLLSPERINKTNLITFFEQVHSEHAQLKNILMYKKNEQIKKAYQNGLKLKMYLYKK